MTERSSPAGESGARGAAGPPLLSVTRLSSGLYFGSALLVVAWAASRLLHGPDPHIWDPSSIGPLPDPVEGSELVAVYFAPLFVYAVSLGVLILEPRSIAPETVSAFAVVPPLVFFVAVAACTHLSVFLPRGTTWSDVAGTAPALLRIAVAFSGLVAPFRWASVRRPKALLAACLLGAAWVLYLAWYGADHDLDPIPRSLIR